MLVTVLYEDQMGRQPRGSGPHALLVTCVQDRLGCLRSRLLDTVVGLPKKGDSKVLAALRDDLEQMLNSGPVVAVLDNDRARECLGLPPKACKREVLASLQARAAGAVTVVLLEQNVDDLARACATALETEAPKGKPDPDERDRMLQAAAWGTPTQRQAILNAMPSFRRLVDKVAEALSSVNQDQP